MLQQQGISDLMLWNHYILIVKHHRLRWWHFIICLYTYVGFFVCFLWKSEILNRYWRQGIQLRSILAISDSSSSGYQLRIRHKGEFYLVYANSDCYTHTSFWSSETSYMDLEILRESVVVMCSGLLCSSTSKAMQQGANGFSFRKMLQKWYTISTESKIHMIPF